MIRIVTWNMGGGSPGGRAASDLHWQALDRLDPDVALLQEVTAAPDGVADNRWHARRRNDAGRVFYTAILARRGTLVPRSFDTGVLQALQGQAVAADYQTGDDPPLLLSSVHTLTGRVDGQLLASIEGPVRDHLPVGQVPSHMDIVLAALLPLTGHGRFVVGGDVNLAWRLDEQHAKGTSMWGSADWFARVRAHGWRRAHLKFHAGEEQSYHGKGGNQLDHFFADPATYQSATRCDFVRLDRDHPLSDHDPLLLEIDSYPPMG